MQPIKQSSVALISMIGRSDVRLGAILAAANVMLFAAMLAARPAQYDEIRRLEAERANGGPFTFSSADPPYIAARAFYPHSPEPWPELVFFLLNLPSELAAATLTFELYPSLSRALAPDLPGSDVRDSWVHAIAIAVCAGLQAFVAGVIISGWKSRE